MIQVILFHSIHHPNKRKEISDLFKIQTSTSMSSFILLHKLYTTVYKSLQISTET